MNIYIETTFAIIKLIVLISSPFLSIYWFYEFLSNSVEEKHILEAEKRKEEQEKVRKLEQENKQVKYGTIGLESMEQTTYFYETEESYITIDETIFFKNSVSYLKLEKPYFILKNL